MENEKTIIAHSGHKLFFYISATVQTLILIFLIYIAYRVISKYLTS